MTDLIGFAMEQAALIVYQHITDDLLKVETIEDICAANRDGEIARDALMTVVGKLSLEENEKAGLIRTIEDANKRYKGTWYRWLENAFRNREIQEQLKATDEYLEAK